MALKTHIPSSKKSPPRRRKKSSSFHSFYKHLFRVVLSIAVVVSVAFGIKYLVDEILYPNPLLGKWRTHTIMGVMEIEFERGSMSSFGTQTAVTYDVDEKRVIVIDDSIKVGVTYTIVDKNTISKEVGKSKVIYKRVQ